MILTPEHPDCARYMAMKGSSPIKGLVRLDTESGEYEAEGEEGRVTGVADRVFYLGPGKLEWVRIDD